MVICVVIMMRTGWRVSRNQSGILVAIGLARWIMDLCGNYFF
ncbi:MAG: hypothetical protein R2874_16980 [Desulfobacterales bacterium]